MAFLDSVKEYLYKKQLEKTIHSSRNTKRDSFTRGKVKTVSIVYAEKGPFKVEEIEKFIDQLKSRGVEVMHLKLHQNNFPKGEKPANAFSKKEISISGYPKDPIIQKFNAEKSDLFYNFMDPASKISSFMNLLNKSKFRIGLKTTKQTGCDLMINLKDNDFNSFIRTSDDILEKMKIS